MWSLSHRGSAVTLGLILSGKPQKTNVSISFLKNAASDWFLCTSFLNSDHQRLLRSTLTRRRLRRVARPVKLLLCCSRCHGIHNSADVTSIGPKGKGGIQPSDTRLFEPCAWQERPFQHFSSGNTWDSHLKPPAFALQHAGTQLIQDLLSQLVRLFSLHFPGYFQLRFERFVF